MSSLRSTSDNKSAMVNSRTLRAAAVLLAFAVALVLANRIDDVQAAAPTQPAVAAGKLPPPPLNVTLTTHDGVSLAATYYGSLVGKEAVPVIMLHQYKGSRADFKDLALALQAKGCAVLVPDLRGHGQSTRQAIQGGGDREISAALLKPQDFSAMVEDLEACKSFLMEKNNAGELNINKLCLVGAEMGAVLAVNWAAWDWHWPRLTTGKQGQDVKALVLISPTWTFRGANIGGIVNNRDVVGQWSWLIVAGDQDSTAASDAKRLDTQLSKLLPTPTDPNVAAEKQAVFYMPVATSLQSAKLIAAKKDSITAEIAKFIDRRLVKQGTAWTDRKSPL
jgi:pimeloyl-ACP methyl ester carboxylesterase